MNVRLLLEHNFSRMSIDLNNIRISCVPLTHSIWGHLTSRDHDFVFRQGLGHSACHPHLSEPRNFSAFWNRVSPGSNEATVGCAVFSNHLIDLGTLSDSMDRTTRDTNRAVRPLTDDRVS